MTTVRNLFWALTLISLSLAATTAATQPVATKGKAPAKAPAKAATKTVAKAAPPPVSKVPIKAGTPAAKPLAKTTTPNHAPATSVASRGRVQPQYGRYSSNRRPAPATARQRVVYYPAPMTPTPERTKEIQAALVQKGYLNSEPTGAWDSDSQAAMKRFQKDQSLDADGKLNSLSLIALGLGPKHTLSASTVNPPLPGATATPGITNPVPPKP